MNYIGTLAFILVIIGALNWGLVGIFDFNLVTFILGEGSTFTKIVYVLVGFSAVYYLVTYFTTEQK